MSNQVVTKKLVLYRNGDPSFKPLPYLYSNRKVRTFDKLLDEFEEKVPPIKGGGIKYLYTVDGRYKVTSIRDLEELPDGQIVVSGAEPFRDVKGGYENLSNASKPPLPQRNRSKERRPSKNDAKETYRQKNKRYYGEVTGTRVEDQIVQGKRIFVRRSGDPDFKPKQYVLRPRATRNWENFLKDLKDIAPPADGEVKFIYTSDGYEIKHIDELQQGETYVAAGEDGFEDPNENPNFEPRKSPRAPQRSPRVVYKSPRRAPTREPTALSTVYKDPAASPRPRTAVEERVYNRTDQIYPNNIHMFVFRNGNGLETIRTQFTEKQLDRGMPFVLEQVAKKHGCNPQKLYTMDGRPVNTVPELENKGAYVLVPLGERFRDTWYYLPDGALDTSEESQKKRQEEEEAYENEYRPVTESEPRKKKNISKRRSSKDYKRPDSANSMVEADRDGYYDDVASIVDEDYDDHQHNHVHRRGDGRRTSLESECSVCENLEHRLARHIRTGHGRRRGDTDSADRKGPIRGNHAVTADTRDDRRGRDHRDHNYSGRRSQSDHGFRRKQRKGSADSFASDQDYNDGHRRDSKDSLVSNDRQSRPRRW